MKKLIIVLLLLLSTLTISAQYNNTAYNNMSYNNLAYNAVTPADFGYLTYVPTKYANTLYATVQPVDFGYGISYNYMLAHRSGLYSTLTTNGNYKFLDGYIHDHTKVAFGYVRASRENISFLTAGLSYNWYGDYSTPEPFPPAVLRPVSFEIGGGVKIERYSVKFMVDVIKWESNLCFGVNFNYRKRTLR